MSDLTTYISNMMYEKGRAYYDFGRFQSPYLRNAGDAIWANQWETAHDWLDAAAEAYLAGLAHTYTDEWGNYGWIFDLRDALTWIDDNWPTGAEVTMSAIINAMLVATPTEIEYFIGLIDAYRLSLWNKPFNAEFYAALARGFE